MGTSLSPWREAERIEVKEKREADKVRDQQKREAERVIENEHFTDVGPTGTDICPVCGAKEICSYDCQKALGSFTGPGRKPGASLYTRKHLSGRGVLATTDRERVCMNTHP
jgi:hypothetical protein